MVRIPFAGKQLPYGWCLALCSYVGFDYGHGLLRAVAVMNGESGRYIGAWHDNLKPVLDANGDPTFDEHGEPMMYVESTDRGLFQINSLHDTQLSSEDAFRAVPNARYAYQLSDHGRNFDAWYVFKNRSIYYEAGLEQAAYFYNNGRGWRKRIDRVPLQAWGQP